ncbi:hypothetical protein GOODEAATRI_019376 [Goodea atripinnis]|uniref:AB hydrolase-1 domain-containing protein n=1 Tax=Goodea atripinnis TaxID=208336 RepID=A0ABV0MU52_9TELE
METFFQCCFRPLWFCSQFVQSIGLDKTPFHLVGTSMGGNVAGVYAASYPSDLCSLTLVCPAGLVYPTESEFISRLKKLEENNEQKESIPLIPSTLKELDAMLKLCCHNPPNLPRQVQDSDQLVLKAAELLLCFSHAVALTGMLMVHLIGEKSRHSLQEHLHLITAPLQVIWGKHDQVLDVSGAAVIQKVLPRCQVDLLDDSGHSAAENEMESRMKPDGEKAEPPGYQRVVLKNASPHHYLKVRLGLVKLWSSLTLQGSYQNQACAFRVLQVSRSMLLSHSLMPS